MTSRNDLDFLNPHEIEPIEETEPQTLTEAMQFAKDYKDFEPLENIICDVEKKIVEAIEEVKFLRDSAHAGGKLTFYEKGLNKILRILNK